MLPKTKWQIGFVIASLAACILGAMQVRVKAIADNNSTLEQNYKILKAENEQLKGEISKRQANESRGHFEKCWFKGATRDVWIDNNVPATPGPSLPKPKSSAAGTKSNSQSNSNDPNCAGGQCNNEPTYYYNRRGGRRW